jgi:hypothetical protein
MSTQGATTKTQQPEVDQEKLQIIQNRITLAQEEGYERREAYYTTLLRALTQGQERSFS